MLLTTLSKKVYTLLDISVYTCQFNNRFQINTIHSLEGGGVKYLSMKKILTSLAILTSSIIRAKKIFYRHKKEAFLIFFFPFFQAQKSFSEFHLMILLDFTVWPTELRLRKFWFKKKPAIVQCTQTNFT